MGQSAPALQSRELKIAWSLALQTDVTTRWRPYDFHHNAHSSHTAGILDITLTVKTCSEGPGSHRRADRYGANREVDIEADFRLEADKT